MVNKKSIKAAGDELFAQLSLHEIGRRISRAIVGIAGVLVILDRLPQTIGEWAGLVIVAMGGTWTGKKA